MSTNNSFYYDHDSPGAGGGKAGNPRPGEMEKKALDKLAGFPGTEKNAAGMHHQEAPIGAPDVDNAETGEASNKNDQ